MLTLPELPIARFVFEFSFTGKNQLPAYAGSAWRGAFGRALKQTVCVVRNTACQSCMLKNSCAYPYIFETPPPPNSVKMRLYEAAPHPFIIKPQTPNHHEIDTVSISIHLFGRSYRYLPYLIFAFEKAGKQGMGKTQQIFQLETVTQLFQQQPQRVIYQQGQLQSDITPETLAIPDCPSAVNIQLETPLRIKQEGKNCNSERLSFNAFFGNLLRRISMLSYFHTDNPLETDFAYLMTQAKTINIQQQQLVWHDWSRYSSRQQTTIEMGGLLGKFTLEDELDVFWPYLWLGQWTHAGKGTSMGLGAYSIEIDQHG